MINNNAYYTQSTRYSSYYIGRASYAVQHFGTIGKHKQTIETATRYPLISITKDMLLRSIKVTTNEDLKGFKLNTSLDSSEVPAVLGFYDDLDLATKVQKSILVSSATHFPDLKPEFFTMGDVMRELSDVTYVDYFDVSRLSFEFVGTGKIPETFHIMFEIEVAR